MLLQSSPADLDIQNRPLPSAALLQDRKHCLSNVFSDAGLLALICHHFNVIAPLYLIRQFCGSSQKSYLPAMCRLAEIYEKGQGAIKPNAKLALHWYERAALNGHTESQFKTAQYYAQGEGCTKNYEQAAKYYLLAAENNHAQAQYNYGVCCYMALGRKKDIDESFRWYQKAADNGLAIAQNELGNCYFYSSGTEKNDAEAVNGIKKPPQATIRLPSAI